MDVTGAFPHCCGDLFNPEPTFNIEGACFTMDKEVKEVKASSMASIKIWTNTDSTFVPSKRQ